MAADLNSVSDQALVIDASVAGAAGQEEASYPTSKNCRDLLNAVLDSPHRIVMTPEIRQEWDNHQKSFAVRWLVAMERQAKIQLHDSLRDEGLRDKMTSLIGQQIGRDKITQEVCAIMLKDCHLLEAALESNKIVLSLDNKARFHFKVASVEIEDISEILWVNPDKAEENAIAWLEAGAEPEKHRQLGFQQSEA